ncbi:MAG TPA: quinol:cytochrome C oxidoreductase, partial [Acidobacteria bacterium]|nr:quinol:cytochrome C oxidoreductase [Acidobacteriota bacterium]
MQQITDISRENRFLEGLSGRLTITGVILGVVGLGAAFGLAQGAEGGVHRLWWSYLMNWVFFLSISLGALGFVLIQHLTKAGWSVVLRRIAEALAANTLVCGLLFIPLLFGLHDLYHWLDAEAVAADHILQHKAGFLNLNFFLIRIAFYFVVWIGGSLFLLRTSIRQDQTGDYRLTQRMEAASAPLMFLYALTVTLASFDLLMSLDPHWFSTIFGVYFFAGGFLAFFALLPVIVWWLQGRERLERAITPEHYQDMGKFMFAFLVFWGYIAFSQFMLIWYGNLPEEIGWYVRREAGTWSDIAWLIVVGHFMLPFAFLMSKHVKRRLAILVLAG